MNTLVVAELWSPAASHRKKGSTSESSMDNDRDDTFFKTSFSYWGSRLFPLTCGSNMQNVINETIWRHDWKTTVLCGWTALYLTILPSNIYNSFKLQSNFRQFTWFMCLYTCKIRFKFNVSHYKLTSYQYKQYTPMSHNIMTTQLILGGSSLKKSSDQSGFRQKHPCSGSDQHFVLFFVPILS